MGFFKADMQKGKAQAQADARTAKDRANEKSHSTPPLPHERPAPKGPPTAEGRPDDRAGHRPSLLRTRPVIHRFTDQHQPEGVPSVAQTAEVLKWRGHEVVDCDGDQLGKIEEISLDAETEMPSGSR